jgi:hypothetical protein
MLAERQGGWALPPCYRARSLAAGFGHSRLPTGSFWRLIGRQSSPDDLALTNPPPAPQAFVTSWHTEEQNVFSPEW